MPVRSVFLRLATVFFALTAGLSLYLGLAEVWNLPLAPRADGALSLAMPWIGAAFYAGLALLSARSPDSPLLSVGLAAYAFAHACLIAEMLLWGRACVGCLSVAAVAALAAGAQVVRRRADAMILASGLLFGMGAAWWHPYERLDDRATRAFWPARLLETLPTFVDREELKACSHDSAVRVFLYEKDCKSCGSLLPRIGPGLERDFRGQVCLHTRETDPVRAGHRLPLLVLVSRRLDHVVIEGRPDMDLLYARIRELGAKPADEQSRR